MDTVGLALRGQSHGTVARLRRMTTPSRLRSTLLAASRFIHENLLWFLIGAYAAAVIYPDAGVWVRDSSLGGLRSNHARGHLSLLTIMLGSLMFNAGLGVKTSHLATLAKKKLMVVAGLAANWLVPTVFIFLVALVMRFWHEPDEAQHILVGSAHVVAMPIAGASTAWAQNSNGNVALSLGLVLFSTLLSPLVTPLVFHVFGAMADREYERVLDHLASYGSGIFLVAWVVLPSLIGLAVRFFVPEAWLSEIMPSIKLINSVVLLLLNYSNAAVSLLKAIADHDLDFLAVTFGITVGLCLVSFAAGDWLSRLFKAGDAERVSLMYGLGMSNNGTGLVLASLALASYPRIMVPIIFYNLIQHFVAGTVQHTATRASAGRTSRHG